MNTRSCRPAALLLAALLTLGAHAEWERTPRLQLLGGYWGGDATYQIGGKVSMDGETYVIHDPLSELVWPIEVMTVGGAATVPVSRHIDLHLAGLVVATSDSGTVEDRDWLTDDVLYIESESDASLSGFMLNGGARWWFDMGGPAAAYPWQISAGLGLLYQSLAWEASNLDQWYPISPGTPHDRIGGLVGTYDLDVIMPYLECCFRMALPRARIAVMVGLAPVVAAHDEDDHVLRYIYAETDAVGVGGLGAASVEVDLTDRLFLRLGADLFGFVADGTEDDTTYAGSDAGSTWSIEHEITSTQYQFTLGLGAVL